MTNVNEMNEFTAPLCPLTGQCQLRHIILDSFEGNLHNKCREYVGLLAICSSLKTPQCGCPDPPFLWKCHSGRESLHLQKHYNALPHNNANCDDRDRALNLCGHMLAVELERRGCRRKVHQRDVPLNIRFVLPVANLS